MESRISFKWTLFLVVSIALIRSAMILFSMMGEERLNDLINPNVVKNLEASLPTIFDRIMIPTAGIDAHMENVGLTETGEIGTPKNMHNVGWYEKGPYPGEKGNAIIDGHFGWRDHIPAVFDTLHTVKERDQIYIIDKKGAVLHFKINSIKRYSEKENTSFLFDSDTDAHISLITCEGVWNKVSQSYSERLIVFADKVVD